MKKRLLAIIVFGISVVCIILGMRCGFSNIDGKLVSGTANGEDRFIVIPKEEQIFYLNKVHSTDLEQAHEDAFAFAEKAYQTVMLAAEYGVIDSFSFDAVQRLCDEMNQLNQEKQRRGEPIMGPKVGITRHNNKRCDPVTVEIRDNTRCHS